MAGDRIRAGNAVFYKRAGRRNLLDLAPTVMIRRRRPRFVIAYDPLAESPRCLLVGWIAADATASGH